jgi:hypothetical protein
MFWEWEREPPFRRSLGVTVLVLRSRYGFGLLGVYLLVKLWWWRLAVGYAPLERRLRRR